MLLALDGDRRIDVHTRSDKAFRWACEWNRLEVVKILLTAGTDRLPSDDAFAAATARWTHIPRLAAWRLHWRNRPKAACMVKWRATVEA